MNANEAKLEITWSGEHGTLPDPVSFEATDGDIRGWVTEAIRTGGVPGIPADPNVNLQDFIVERYPSKEGRPDNVLMLRPKTPFG